MDQWRITVLGDGGVGKTALAVQFTMNSFVGQPAGEHPSPSRFINFGSFYNQTYDPTIEDAYRKTILVDERPCFIEVIDTAGQEEYATLREQWVREGQGFILVYSIASRRTFDRLEVFRNAMLRVKRAPPVFILIGNKCDKTYEREVSREEGQALARSFGCEFLETSAKTPHNVERMFTTLVRNLRGERGIEAGNGAPKQTTGGGPGGKKKKSCVIF